MDNSSGKLGEEEVAKFLEQKGYSILQKNYHSRFGEIDIIAQKIVLTAKEYLARNHTSLQPRFDAAALITEDGSVVETEYLENAFFS